MLSGKWKDYYKDKFGKGGWFWKGSEGKGDEAKGSSSSSSSGWGPSTSSSSSRWE